MAINGIGSPDRNTSTSQPTRTPAPAARPSAPQARPATAEPARVIPDGFSADRLVELRELTSSLQAPAAPPPSTGFSAGGEVTSGFERPTASATSLEVPYQAQVKGEVGYRSPAGYGASFGVSAQAKTSVALGAENGVASFRVSADVSVTARGSISVPVGGVEGSHTRGVTASYTVAMPEAVAHTLDPATVNPFDPSTMPTGAVVTLEGSQYATTELNATFRALAVQTKVTEAEGVSVAITRTSPTSVRVSAGPTEAVRAYNGVGLELGVGAIRLGRQDNLDGATLRSAEFDLSTPEGAAGYRDFLTRGQLPTANGPGVSGVSTTDRTTFTSTTQLGARLGPRGNERALDGTVDLNGNAGTFVRTTNADGTATGSAELRYGSNVELSVQQRFGTDGREDLEARAYSYALTPDANTAVMINAALGTDSAVAGRPVDLTLTQAQMRELQGAAQRALAAGATSLAPLLNGNQSAEDFAIGLARNLGHDTYGVAADLFSISEFSDGVVGNDLTPLPGQIIIRP